MKLKRVICMILLAVMICCGGASALADASGVPDPAAIHPRGAFLWIGECTLTPMTGQCKVRGNTECYYAVDDVSVTLELYVDTGSGIWARVWADTYSAQNTDAVYTPTIYITCDPGRYYLKATHTAWSGGRKETNTSETRIGVVY